MINLNCFLRDCLSLSKSLFVLHHSLWALFGGFCGGPNLLRFHISRIGTFELASGVTLHKGVAKGVDAATLKKAASKDGYRSMRDQGMEVVFSGGTSLEEMQRVFSAKKKKSPPGKSKPRVRS